MVPPVISSAATRTREFWSFYRRYTHTAAHTAATATLAIFGILVFVDPWFAALAIASYVLPPVVLYAIGAEPPSPQADEVETDTEARSSTHDRTTGRSESDGERSVEPVTSTVETERPRKSRGRTTATDDGGNGDTDSDSDDGDTDTDSDADGTDTDSDTDDGDTDSDSDSDDGDTDSDSDSDDGDTDSDSDSDDGDTDSDSDRD